MNIAYRFIQYNLWWYTKLFFKKVNIKGLHNIPKKGGVIFVVNHQNTVVDALLTGMKLKKELHFLVKADAFQGRISNLILRALKLIPIYRTKDVQSNQDALSKNSDLFTICAHKLNTSKQILIFPEGGSYAIHQLTPLKKGLARMVKHSLSIYPDTQITLIPVAINYENHFLPNHQVWINYLSPITIHADLVADIHEFTKFIQGKILNQLICLPPNYPTIQSYFKHLNRFPENFKEQNTQKYTRNYHAQITKQQIPFWVWILFFPAYLSIKFLVNTIKDSDYYLSISFLVHFIFLFIYTGFLLFCTIKWGWEAFLPSGLLLFLYANAIKNYSA